MHVRNPAIVAAGIYLVGDPFYSGLIHRPRIFLKRLSIWPRYRAEHKAFRDVAESQFDGINCVGLKL